MIQRYLAKIRPFVKGARAFSCEERRRTEIAEIARRSRARTGTNPRKINNNPNKSARKRNIRGPAELFCCGEDCSAGPEACVNILFPCGSSLCVRIAPILAAGFCTSGVEARLYDVYGLRR